MFIFAADSPVGISAAVHAKPAKRERMRFGKGATTHDRGRDWNLRGFGKLAQLFAGVPANDSATAIKHGPFGFFDQTDDLVEDDIVSLRSRPISAKRDLFGPDRLRFALLNILGNIHNHRTGSAGL